MEKYNLYKKKLTERGYKHFFGLGHIETWGKSESNLVDVNFEEQTAALIHHKQYLGIREQFKSLCK